MGKIHKAKEFALEIADGHELLDAAVNIRRATKYLSGEVRLSKIVRYIDGEISGGSAWKKARKKLSDEEKEKFKLLITKTLENHKQVDFTYYDLSDFRKLAREKSNAVEKLHGLSGFSVQEAALLVIAFASPDKLTRTRAR